MSAIRTLILDGDAESRRRLLKIIINTCPELEITGVAASLPDISAASSVLQPDLMLLDSTAMKLLEAQKLVAKISAEIAVMTDAADATAARFQTAALSVIEKPVQAHQVRATIAKLVDIRKSPNQYPADRHSRDSVTEGKGRIGLIPQRILLQRPRGLRIARITDILYIASDKNYTTVTLASGESIVVSYSLLDFERKLDPSLFFRIHRSYIVGLLHVHEYFHQNGNYIVISNGEKLPLSYRRFRKFLLCLEESMALAVAP